MQLPTPLAQEAAALIEQSPLYFKYKYSQTLYIVNTQNEAFIE